MPAALATVRAGLAVLLTVSAAARADDRTWTGGGGDNRWTTAANWFNTAAPVAGDALFFGGTTRLTPSNDVAADTSFAGITFNSGAGAFVLSGNRITLGGNVTNNSTSVQTVQLDMILDSTRTVAGSGSMTLQGALSGDGGLTKTGSGILTLSGSSANTYTGPTNVSGGTLTLGKSANVISVPGDLDISGGAKVTFSAHNVNQQIASDAAVTMSGASSALNCTGFNADFRNVTQTIGSLGVTGGVFHTGTGTWTVTGAASFTGGAGNTIFLGNSGATAYFGSLSLTNMNAASSGNVANSFSLYGNDATQSSIFVRSGGLSLENSVIHLRRGSVTNAKGSRLVLDGDVTTTGTSASRISEDTAGGTNGAVAVQLSSTAGAVTRTFNIGGGGADLTISVPVTNGASSSAGITKTGAGTLTLSGANTFSGDTKVDVGTLQLGDALALQNSTFDTQTGSVGTLSFGALTEATFGGLKGANGLALLNGSSAPVTLTVGGNNASTTFSGSLSGTGGALIKTGSGTLTLSGSSANTYTGLTTVSGGTLALGKASGNAVGGDLTISGGRVTFSAGNPSNQIADGATVTMSGASSAFNGTAFNADYQAANETIGSLIVTGGAFNTGTGGTGWTVTGAASFTGGAGNTKFLGHSSSTSRFGSLSLTGMTETAGGTADTANSFTLYGNSGAKPSSIVVGSGGLTLDNSVINLRRGGTGALGSRLVLDGDVTTTGTSASRISEDTAGGVNGAIAVQLSSTADAVTREFNIGGGGADLTISVPVTNGAASSAGITKIGDGTLTLSGSMPNTYTGLTTVEAGRLALSKSAGVNAVAGDLAVSGGVVTFGADEQIANSATVTMSGAASVFNGTGFDAGFRNTSETIGSLVVTGGIFQTGIGASWTVTDAVSFTGGAGNNTIFIGNSGSTSSFGGLSLTDMDATSSGNTPSSFTLYGSHGTWQSSITVGSGGLNLKGSVVNLRLGGTGAKGSRLVLDGNVTTTGTSASSIVLEGGTTGDVAVELSSTGAAVTREFNIGDGANLTISVPVTNGESSSAGINKTGLGTLILSGANTYTGGTTISAGTVLLGATNVLADTGPVTVSGGGKLDIVNRSDTIGALTLTSGTVAGTTGVLTASSYDVRSGTISAALGGSGGLTKITSGTVTLSGTTANTYTGLTTVSGGRLALGKSAGVNAVPGNLTISGGAVTFSANQQIADDATVTMSGATSFLNGTGLNGNVFNVQETIGSLVMNGGMFQTGTGGWTVNGAASFTGGAGNTVFIGNSGGTFRFGSLSLTNMTRTVGTTGNHVNSFTLYGNHASTQSSIIVGSGGLTLEGSVLNLRRGDADRQGSRLVLDGNVTTTGTSSSSISEDIAGGTGGAVAVQLSSTAGAVIREFNIGGGGADLTVGVPVTNGAATSAGITKTGAGTLFLRAASTYTGLTTVLGGTLEVTGSLANNTSADVLVASAGTAFDGTEPAIVRSVGDGAPFAGLGSQIIGDRLFDTRADLLAGTNQDPSGDPLPVGMAWRMFADGESQSTASYLHAVSDVVQLTGITETSPFVLQMTYDASLVTPATQGGLHLAWLDGGQWVNAVAGNSAVGDDAVARYLGSWDAFTNAYGSDLDALLGSWGVDTGGTSVWAVLNHNSEFGVLVPEPGTWLMLLAAGTAGLLLRRRGKR
ncbi:MAG: autotransporter-associated beta strand repeat-containing protein [Thermoguttaceae bacterium]|jgi:autotransporter-associated beta strand protein|nr:autotransporter-associated beta strand repeat-containing protein [Thermoguttaceae bacterium]